MLLLEALLEFRGFVATTYVAYVAGASAWNGRPLMKATGHGQPVKPCLCAFCFLPRTLFCSRFGMPRTEKSGSLVGSRSAY